MQPLQIRIGAIQAVAEAITCQVGGFRADMQAHPPFRLLSFVVVFVDVVAQEHDEMQVFVHDTGIGGEPALLPIRAGDKGDP